MNRCIATHRNLRPFPHSLDPHPPFAAARPGWGGLPTFANLVTNGCLRHSGHIPDYKCQRCAHLPEGLAEAHFLENRKATVRKKKADRKALCRHFTVFVRLSTVTFRLPLANG